MCTAAALYIFCSDSGWRIFPVCSEGVEDAGLFFGHRPIPVVPEARLIEVDDVQLSYEHNSFRPIAWLLCG
jgi:hypothetical protein